MKPFEPIEGLASNYVNVIKTVFSIMRLELRLAGLSVYPLLLNVCLLLMVVMTFWASFMILLGYGFYLFFASTLSAITFVLVLNLGLLIVLLSYLRFNLQQMSFEKTRQYFFKEQGADHDELKKKSEA